MDFGELYNINDVLVSVDNNDDYEVTWSLDSVSWSNLFTINRSDGEITWGMDTFSTDTLHNEYIAAIDFSTVQARYLRIKVTGGDFGLSIGEFQAFGSKLTTSVPEPSSLAIFALGFIGLIIRSVKKRS
ncbi:PEP-CTERM sorting domain-containing protein [Colwellia sp. MSW7]|uniref:PEP-CTERM sorting domain-containing protein n=1 Tax=Colwellia maritima TaxID=2912588 RepID=A0ABS9X4L8_9GAMM|nr:PEP-CTERM sorting domain-containing protein [Colwellia maritima]MCI2284712.1 PEP-CTERM sorting domain-containing protein [Colwellia maritima]